MTLLKRRPKLADPALAPATLQAMYDQPSAPEVEYDVVELFAGPGGASLGLKNLGLHGLGIEKDDAACKTRIAAGLATLMGDVSILDPTFYRGVPGFWASPPCQGFSKAGLQKGLGDANRILAHIGMCLQDMEWVDFEEEEGWEDERSQLVLEPLRWIFGMQPRWVVLEQVPFVIIIWEAMKPVLEALGYNVWVGKLYSEQYGVAQTRERAFLIASLDGPVQQPEPTHSRYYARTPEKLDSGVPKWVSMAQALGWTGTVGFPRRADTPSNKTTGTVEIDGVDYRARDFHDVERPSPVITEKARSWMRRAVVSTGNNSSTIGPGPKRKGMSWRDTSTPWERSIHVPAPTVDTKAPGAWAVHPPGERHTAINGQPEATLGEVYDFLMACAAGNAWAVVEEQITGMRTSGMHKGQRQRTRNPESEPAATITGQGSAMWVLGTGSQLRQNDRSVPRSLEKPAPTVAFGNDASQWRWLEGTPDGYARVNDQTGTPWDKAWPFERPATVLATRDLVQHPGANANRFNGKTKSRNDGLRVSVEEAGVLQSFPVGYPWQGSRTKQFEQVGNAVPPLLASHAALVAAGPTMGEVWTEIASDAISPQKEG